MNEEEFAQQPQATTVDKEQESDEHPYKIEMQHGWNPRNSNYPSDGKIPSWYNR